MICGIICESKEVVAYWWRFSAKAGDDWSYTCPAKVYETNAPSMSSVALMIVFACGTGAFAPTSKPAKERTGVDTNEMVACMRAFSAGGAAKSECRTPSGGALGS